MYICLLINNFEHVSRNLNKSRYSFPESSTFMVIEIVIFIKIQKNWASVMLNIG